MHLFWVAILLGVVEGLTEFLPVSSTGHLIVTSELIGFEGKRAEVFEIVIQLGAILAVVWEFRARLFRVASGLLIRREARGFVWNILLAFIPSAVLGLLFYDWIFEKLFSSASVAAALVVGALAILFIEQLDIRVRTGDIEAMTRKQALWIGLAQCFSLWPGFSRAAATILGGVCVGLDRRTATEFSFFLAIPTMFGATAYNLMKNYRWLEPADLGWLSLSFIVSFLVGWAAVRWLLQYVSTHTFRAFAWYRLVIGVVILFVL